MFLPLDMLCKRAEKSIVKAGWMEMEPLLCR